jgi:hypothetical protein
MSNATFGHTCDASAAVRIDETDLFVGASDKKVDLANLQRFESRAADRGQ